MPLSPDEELELLQLEEEEYQASLAPAPASPKSESLGESLIRGTMDYAVPVATSVGGAMLGSMAGPVGTVGGGAAGYATGKELGRLGNQFLLGDDRPQRTMLEQGGQVAKDLGEGLAAEAMGPLAGKVSKYIGERVATSPVPKKIADALNVSHHAKSLVNKGLDFVNKIYPNAATQSAKGVVEATAPVTGRIAAYSHFPSNVAQGVSDVARLVEKGQGPLAKVMDKSFSPATKAIAQKTMGGVGANAVGQQVHPVLEKAIPPAQLAVLQNTKYADLLNKAAERGEDSVRTTQFLLSQDDPEYQELMQTVNDGN